MLAKLEFTLPEQAEEFEEALRGHDWKAVVINMLSIVRGRLKYVQLTSTTTKELEDLRTVILDDIAIRNLSVE